MATLGDETRRLGARGGDGGLALGGREALEAARRRLGAGPAGASQRREERSSEGGAPWRCGRENEGRDAIERRERPGDRAQEVGRCVRGLAAGKEREDGPVRARVRRG